MLTWLLEAGAFKAMDRAQAAGLSPSAVQQGQIDARVSALDSGNNSRILKTAGNIAEISIQGVLTKSPDFFAMFFGGGNTTYAELIGAIAAAEQDPAITEARFAVDSPGGSIDDLFEAVAAIQNMTMPTTAIVSNLAASAAFALVAATDRIEAVNTAARFGSVGIVAGFRVDDNIVEITSTDAPDKRPDVTTDEGKAVVRDGLDGIHQLFVDAIATGRDTTAEKVNADFGRGATILAEEALKRGMIDGIVGQAQSTPVTIGGNSEESIEMDLATLKASHPAVYAAAVSDGKEIGLAEERDRVGAHLTMGAASGDMTTALEAVEAGTAMTATLQAKYMSAGMNKANVEARGADDAGTDAAQDGAAAPVVDATDQSAEVASLVEAALGTVVEA